MAKILCATSGLTGILNASFELVARLQMDGHEVIYATPKPVGRRVEAQGIHYIQLPEITDLSDNDIPKYKGPFRKVNRWVYKIRQRKARQEKGLAIVRPTDFQNLIATIQPDLILLDVELHEYIIRPTPLQFHSFYSVNGFHFGADRGYLIYCMILFLDRVGRAVD